MFTFDWLVWINPRTFPQCEVHLRDNDRVDGALHEKTEALCEGATFIKC
uniref:Uncharacterized protein n=1 Tax=Rhizophora mucronata TaxID=61149 RepID=A0A2P2ITP5_RHIMU